ncbi:PIN-like domain-containing protein [Paenibacillus sp. 23TSA30-6]|uniref:PIN-like domain-containing protein n=1 Tax=Paenibacillus sp. 23TSA30-6 TaxID=2546104 RepID=UPI001787D9A2|nr:PIN-like domain-containing protein [Paenibacillus sp. 23TSA30-6]MBE0336039.1 hypothetical protein [Paenibacillus sp. 23TSA30-6]
MRINEERLKYHWDNSEIALDTSTLLFLRQCHSEYAKELIDIFMFKKDSIWIPQKVKEEFETNNKKDSLTGMSSIKGFQKNLNESITRLKNSIDSERSKLESSGFSLLSEVLFNLNIDRMFIETLQEFSQKGSQLSETNREFIKSGIIGLFYKQIFSNVGEGFSENEIKAIEVEGVDRYEKNIPPGDKDKNKKVNKYGDLIIWKQILKYLPKSKKRSFMFITRDGKSDWFDQNTGMVRTELKQEVKRECPGSEFDIILLEDLIRHGSLCFNKDLSFLLDNLEKDEELVNAIEIKMNSDLRSHIEDELNDELKSYADADYIRLDTIESIDINAISYEDEEEDCMLAEASVSFQCYYDYVIHSDGEDFEFSGSATVNMTLQFNIEVEQGENETNYKTIKVDLGAIDFDNIDVEEASDPREEDEEEVQEPDCDDYEPDEPEQDDDYYEDSGYDDYDPDDDRH